jgi:midasin
LSDIPEDELVVILEERCLIPGSYAKRMVEVLKELQRRRQSTQVRTATLRLSELLDRI